MAKPHKKNKYTKATKPTAKTVSEAKDFIQELYEEEKLKKTPLQKAIAEEMAAVSYDQQLKDIAASMGSKLKEMSAAKKKTFTTATAALAAYNDGVPTAKQFCTYLRQKLSHVDARVTDVKMWWAPEAGSWNFTIYLDNGNKVAYGLSEHMIEASSKDPEQLAYKVANDVAATIKKQFGPHKPKQPPYLLGGQVGHYYTSPVHNFIDGGWDKVSTTAMGAYTKAQAMQQQGFTKEEIFKEIYGGGPATKSPPPTPPEKDKDYGISPDYVYNEAVKHLKNSAASDKYHNDLWGHLKKDTLAFIEQIEQNKAEWAKKNAHKYKNYNLNTNGFSGHVVQDSLRDVLPCLYEVVKCPHQGCSNSRVMSEQIIHLNDEHDWTREAIADWAESLDIDISVKEREE